MSTGEPEKGVALILVIITTILFSILGVGVLFYAGTSVETGYYEVKKMKAIHAGEAAFSRALYDVHSGVGDGTYQWQLVVGSQTIPLNYTILTNADGTKTITSSVPNVRLIQLYSQS